MTRRAMENGLANEVTGFSDNDLHKNATLEALGGIPQTPIMEDLDLVQAMKRYGRLALLPLDAVTSSRRHRAGGVLRTAVRHALAAFAWGLGADRERIAAWVRR